MRGKVALVTGSTSGIGLGIAREFATAGADIALNGFGDRDEIEGLRAEIADEFGVRVAFAAADVSKPAEIHHMIDAVTADLGGIDVLVNNAGIQHTAPVVDFPPERWDAILAINLSAVFHGTQAVLPQMLARDWGRVINIASTHGLVASPDKSAYVAAKHGVVGLTKVVALETARTGVTCNAICPGWTLTALVRKQIDDRAAEKGIGADEASDQLLGEKQPSMDFVTPAQIGALAAFLCSPGADQIRGQAIPIDGGWTAR